MSDKPVVVYGASGYTGRLVCEFLIKLKVPFVAAGRDMGKLKAGLDTVPGLDSGDYEMVEVAHNVEALTELLTGTKAMCNMVGPFMEFGPASVEACHNAGVHYMDTTGEQDWMMWCRENFGAKFAEKNLLLSPGIAQMYTTGEIAANYCLENPGLDTLDMSVFWKGQPTVASTATIVQNAVLSKALFLENNELVEWPSDAGLYSLNVPGQHEPGLALPWGGTSSPIWFQNDDRVRNCRVLGGVINRPLMEAVPGLVAQMLELTAGKSLDETRAILAGVAAQVNNTYPPREDPHINISIDSVYASGPLARAHTVIYGNCNYQQTGLLQAYAAQQCLDSTPKQVGFASACQAFGHRELHGVLKTFGLSMDAITTYNG
ncbi:MAG TPA: DUF5938 domain-containing protein [Sporichthya sp.]|nr:DUF5938 domain-containing protein [Sporichthya sp.]